MSVSASPNPSDAVQPGAELAAFADERRLRVCLLTLFSTAAFWLVIGSAFSLIASIKFHSPEFLADPAWLTYGRVRAAANGLVLYGFCVPGALGVALWILARSARTAIAFPPGVLVGAGLLNIGVTIGLGAILMGGELTGFEAVEMPRYAALFIFLGYAIAGASAVLTLHTRNHPGLTVPEWYLLAAIFWFPWIYSTVNLLLLVYPVRGVAQSVIAWWYAANFQLVWLGLVGLGAVFYLLPRLLGRELNSRYMALFAFWILVLFGSWTGVPQTAPVPAWMPVMSTVATVITSLLFIAVFMTTWNTATGLWRESWRGAAGFVSFGVSAFLVSGLIAILPIIIRRADWLNFTWLGSARWQFAVYGFFAMVVFACIYMSLSEFAGPENKLPRFARAQFWLASIGTVVLGFSLAGAGVIQGLKLRNADIAFVDVSKATLHFLRMSTIGDLLILAANMVLLFSLMSYIIRSCATSAKCAFVDATAEVQK